MKIKSIEYCNFRQFKEQGKVYFSTDGKVTIIYGKNGDGKTTLHQLFQWILYNEVHFNKTASDKMYNLEFAKNAETNKAFNVWGQIDFDHDGVSYSVRREYTYKKETLSVVLQKEDFSVRRKVDNDWGDKLNKPQDFINRLLPKELSEYFFFDGETMIADLNQLGEESASKLKNSLYSIFDMDKYQQAVDHIGRTDLKTTVLGKLFIDLGKSSSSEQVEQLKLEIDNIQNQIESLKEKIAEQEKIRKEKRNIVRDLSEQIGSRLSKEELEKQREEQIKLRDEYLSQIDEFQNEFGNTIYDVLPKAFLYKKMQDARNHIKLKIDKEELTPGINKILLDNIINSSNQKCICGRPLYQEQIDILREYYKLLPPDSYKSLYDNFTTMVNLWGGKYNKDTVEKSIKNIINNYDKAKACDKKIADIIEAEKSASTEIEKLVTDRQKAEEEIENVGTIIEEHKSNCLIFEKALKKKMKEYTQLVSASENYKKISAQIEVMEKVKQWFEDELKAKSINYSQKLCKYIQELVDTMLTSKRSVVVTPDFFFKVSDSYNDQSKSEGQFAIVSFAYIGGILKMLSQEDTITNKEYPLVLDGPFSKLDSDQRQNVVDTIPAFAPQVIIFSKDDLTDCFENLPNVTGYIWTIRSNEEKNVAVIEEGYRWIE